MKQYEAVIETLERLGGIATLGKLNQEVFKIKDCEWKTKTPFASIRRIVPERNEIYRIKAGLWALTSHRKELEAMGIIPDNEQNGDVPAVNEFNHSYYQGILLEIGNNRGFDTFVPDQDKNKRFANTTLKEVRSLDAIPPFSYSDFVYRSSTIDVIWFNERKMPCHFFEVEHSTDIQNSLLKFFDLQDFYSKMFIVADIKRKEEYKRKIHYQAFKPLVENDRIKFLDYETLHKIYNQTMEKKNISVQI